MASSHYARTVCEYLDDLKIDYVTKERNAPTVPNQRLIEKFWALCKKKYKELNKECDTIRKFKNAWMKISKEVAEKSGHNLFIHFKRNLYDGGYKGL
jgi:hypothetical protein